MIMIMVMVVGCCCSYGCCLQAQKQTGAERDNIKHQPATINLQPSNLKLSRASGSVQPHTTRKSVALTALSVIPCSCPCLEFCTHLCSKYTVVDPQLALASCTKDAADKERPEW